MYSEQDRGLVVAVTVFFVIKSAVSQMSETIKKNNHPVLDSLETETTAERNLCDVLNRTPRQSEVNCRVAHQQKQILRDFLHHFVGAEDSRWPTLLVHNYARRSQVSAKLFLRVISYR